MLKFVSSPELEFTFALVASTVLWFKLQKHLPGSTTIS